MKNPVLSLCSFFFLILSVPALAGHNLHLIDADPKTGFAIYRSGAPGNAANMKEFCDLGVQEVMVLSGTADKNEEKFKSACPSLKVIYNEDQNDAVPVTAGFMRFFEKWVREARATGKKILFRCECGCHRTGRLAAYYQMEYQGATAEQAYAELRSKASFMWMHGWLKDQVYGLEDHLKGRPCQPRDTLFVNEEHRAVRAPTLQHCVRPD